MDELTLPGVREAIANGQDEITVHNNANGHDYVMLLPLTERQRGMLLYGGLLNYTREMNK